MEMYSSVESSLRFEAQVLSAIEKIYSFFKHHKAASGEPTWGSLMELGDKPVCLLDDTCTHLGFYLICT